MVAILSPGQGSQSAGMLAPWLTGPSADDRVARWSELAQLDLREAGTTWSDEAIRDTAVAQPLLTATALLSARALLGDAVPDAVCGHSVGELPALAVAGVLTDDDVITLAALRGRVMAAATRQAPTGMAAVLGGEEAEVLAVASSLGLELATVNAAGQLVLGGALSALDELDHDPPRGARVRRLAVAGAFHTTAMQPARHAFDSALATQQPRSPRTTIIANADGAIVTDPNEVLRRLGAQLVSAVRFDRCLETLAASGATALIELAPGGTLTALAKRALPGRDLVALRTPDDLSRAQALLHPTGENAPIGWLVLPSPDSGVVDPLVAPGVSVATGTPVAVVSGRSGASTVLAPSAARVTEWLVASGDPVRTGQPLVVLT